MDIYGSLEGTREVSRLRWFRFDLASLVGAQKGIPSGRKNRRVSFFYESTNRSISQLVCTILGLYQLRLWLAGAFLSAQLNVFFLVFFLFDEILKVFIRVVNFLKKMYIDC